MQPLKKTPQADGQSLLKEQPGKLICDPGISRTRVAVVAMLALLVMGGLAFAFTLLHRHGGDAWLVPVAILMGLAVVITFVLVLRRTKRVFDLEARRLQRGKREVPFEDILGVVLTATAAKPAKSGASQARTHSLSLVIRSRESDLSERVARFARALSDGYTTDEQLTSLGERLPTEAERLAQTASPVAAFQAADRLTVELRVVLFDLRDEPAAWTHKQLTRTLRQRLADAEVSPPDPGPPPDDVQEETGPDSPQLHFRRPKRQPLVTMLVNLAMLGVLLAIFFLVPSGDQDRTFNWGQIWPLMMAILLVIPALLKSLFSQNWLELGADRLVYVTRFLGEKRREVEVGKLRFLLVEEVGQVALVLISDGPALRLPMSLKSATWVKARLEQHLAPTA